MLGGVLCARLLLKPWILTSLSHVSSPHHHHHHHHHHHNSRLLLQTPITFLGHRRQHTHACRHASSTAGAASIWHGILPSRGGEQMMRNHFRPAIHHHDYLLKGEGSWNVACDTRPARWLHRPDSAWLLFGVCDCLDPPHPHDYVFSDAVVADEKLEPTCDPNDDGAVSDETTNCSSASFRVTGVLADGRCLFRAIAHGVCLRSGEEAPDENRQRELADELRAQVVDELLRRREETEWFIEGDFDAYLKRIQKPYVWGGEPELLMASHVLETPISVYMIDRTSNGLINIANYGEEYLKNQGSPIKVLFHGYGHYDLVETLSDQSYQKV